MTKRQKDEAAAISYHFWEDKRTPPYGGVFGMIGGMTDMQKLRELEEKLDKYKKIYLDKKRNFRGVRHESAISELRYTEYMVYRSMVEGLEKEIRFLRENCGCA